MSIKHTPAVTINCPEWFARTDFMAWLNNSIARKEMASWHNGAATATEYADTFMWLDAGQPEGPFPIGPDGSNIDDDFPADILTELTLACLRHGFREGIIRFTNLAE